MVNEGYMKADLKKGFENALSRYPRNSNLNNSLNDGAAIAYMDALKDLAGTLKCSGIPEYEKLGHELGQLKRCDLCTMQGDELRNGVYICNSNSPTECQYQILAGSDETGDGSVEVLCMDDEKKKEEHAAAKKDLVNSIAENVQEGSGTLE